MDITEFIAARLDEDEAAAKAAAPGPWEGSLYVGAPGVGIILQGRHFEDGAHAVRHDPVRVLREVAAKRVIAELHSRMHDCPVIVPTGNPEVFPGSLGYVSTEHVGDEADALDFMDGMCTTLRSLAAVWSGHADYRAEWKP